MNRTQERPERSGQRSLWVGGVLVCIVLITLGMRAFWEEPSHLPDAPMGNVPDFILTERNGQKIHKSDLLGKVWIADLIYTQCTTECLLLSSRMAQLQAVFSQEKDVLLVSVTVDPEHDTPEVLQRYAERYNAHARQWLFLTGEKEAIYRLAQEGFRLGVKGAKAAAQSPSLWALGSSWGKSLVTPTVAWAHHDGSPAMDASILHSNRLVLVDRLGNIWGYYDSTEQAAMRTLQYDVRALLQKH